MIVEVTQDQLAVDQGGVRLQNVLEHLETGGKPVLHQFETALADQGDEVGGVEFRALGEVLLGFLEILVEKKKESLERKTDALVDADAIGLVDVQRDLVNQVLLFLLVGLFGTLQQKEGGQTVQDLHFDFDIPGGVVFPFGEFFVDDSLQSGNKEVLLVFFEVLKREVVPLLQSGAHNK